MSASGSDHIRRGGLVATDTRRCLKPCGLNDSRQRGNGAKGGSDITQHHSCLIDLGHPGNCRFIGTCGREALSQDWAALRALGGSVGGAV